MVLLTLTAAGKSAIQQYYQSAIENEDTDIDLRNLEIGSAIEHTQLVAISKSLLSRKTIAKREDRDAWRLDTLLKSSSVYTAPAKPKPEPSNEYKELMQRLRREEEQRQYNRMLNNQPGIDILSKQVKASNQFNPMLSHGRDDTTTVDEATYQDVDRQLTLIINVLVTVIASGVTIWFAARYWAAPQRIALSLLGSAVIAVAEVAVYMGYIRRIQDAKTLERKKSEKTSISETWVIEQSSAKASVAERNNLRHRKGKHR